MLCYRTTKSINLLEYLGDTRSTNSSEKNTRAANATIAYQLYESLPKPKLTNDVLQYWRQRENDLPIMAKLAKNVLCVVGSSVASESLFSDTGYIISECRNRLLPVHAQELSFIRQNCHFAEALNLL